LYRPAPIDWRQPEIFRARDVHPAKYIWDLRDPHPRWKARGWTLHSYPAWPLGDGVTSIYYLLVMAKPLWTKARVLYLKKAFLAWFHKPAFLIYKQLTLRNPTCLSKKLETKNSAIWEVSYTYFMSGVLNIRFRIKLLKFNNFHEQLWVVFKTQIKIHFVWNIKFK